MHDKSGLSGTKIQPVYAQQVNMVICHPYSRINRINSNDRITIGNFELIPGISKVVMP